MYGCTEKCDNRPLPRHEACDHAIVCHGGGIMIIQHTRQDCTTHWHSRWCLLLNYGDLHGVYKIAAGNLLAESDDRSNCSQAVQTLRYGCMG
jgi:hypothetical protein